METRKPKLAMVCQADIMRVRKPNARAAEAEALRELGVPIYLLGPTFLEDAERVAEFQAEQLSSLDVPAMGQGIRAGLLDAVWKTGELAGRTTEELENARGDLQQQVQGADFTGLALTALDEHVFVGALEALEELEPDRNAWLRFHQRVKPSAYRVDVTTGTTPVFQRLGNLADAKSNYGAIVYNKAPASLRELGRIAPVANG